MQFPEKASQLKSLLAARGLSPNHRFGQNFLIESRILDAIVRVASLDPKDLILEVGTGTGNLTHRLAAVAGLVVTVEIDAGVHTLARDLLGNQTNVRLIHGDIMDGKSSLNSEVCEKIDVALVAPDIHRFKVVANLPYNITTPFLHALLARYGAPDLMVLTVQKELAENLVASPGTKDYGPLTVISRLLCDVSIERTLSPGVFWPKPRVQSAIVTLAGKGRNAPDVMRAQALIQFLFQWRRKSLGVVLKRLPLHMGGPMTDEGRIAALEQAGIDPRRRAESLDPEQFLGLSRAITDNTEGG